MLPDFLLNNEKTLGKDTSLGGIRYLIAFFCFFLSLLYWVKIIGLYNIPLWRIDLMPKEMQFFTIGFALIYPIIMIGLWNDSSWGMLLWYVTIFFQLSTLFLYKEEHNLIIYILLANLCLIIAVLYCRFRHSK